MAYQDELNSAGAAPDQPTMELLDGAQAAPPVCCSLVSRIVRGTLYGVLLLTATSLLAISSVPELTNYLSFLPGDKTQGTCHLSSGSCATLDFAAMKNLEGSPCCPLSAAMARSAGGCSQSCADDAALASVSIDSPGCCQKGDSACEHESCPLTTLAKTTAEQAVEDTLAKLPSSNEFAGPPAPPVAE
ncbi:MAG: hypothetical protein AB7U20_13700 [Planctomycetaceae bacterium]